MTTQTDLDTARAILSLASLRDSRIPRPDHPDAAGIAAALAEDLAGVDPQAAIAAVGTHYRESTDRIMAAHIRGIVRRTIGGPVAPNPGAALADAEGSRGDLIAAPHPEDLRPRPTGPAPANGAAAIEAALHNVAAKRALPEGTAHPTGFEPRRRRRTRTKATAVVPAAPQTPPGMLTCFGPCTVNVPIPTGWNPADPNAERLYCPKHRYLGQA